MGFEGGGSPLHPVTERMAAALRAETGLDILTFHRYNPDTHAAFFEAVNARAKPVECVTLFPHYSKATVGSIEGIFAKRIDAGIPARQDSAEDFSRLNALLCTATDWIFIPAYCSALP